MAQTTPNHHQSVGRRKDAGRLANGAYDTDFQEVTQVECKNYRGICLLNTSYKILAEILFKRLTVYVDAIIGGYQGGDRQLTSFSPFAK